MKSKFIPANLAAATKVSELVKGQIDALEKLTSTKKRPSMQDDINKDRLQGLSVESMLNDSEMDAFGELLDPHVFDAEFRRRRDKLGTLSSQELIDRLVTAELHLEIERGYAGVVSRSFDQLWHKFDGDEFVRTVTNSRRQKGREELFEEDKKYLKKCFNEVKKRKGAPLTRDDYPVFRSEVYLNRPAPLFKQEPRLTGEFKDLSAEQKNEERQIMKDEQPAWSEPRLRDFFEEKAKVKISQK